MVLGRFFSKQAAAAAATGGGGGRLGDVTSPDDARDPRLAAPETNVAAIFSKKKHHPVAAAVVNRKLDNDDDSSEEEEEEEDGRIPHNNNSRAVNDDDTYDSGEGGFDDDSSFYANDKYNNNSSDDMTVDTTTSSEIHNRIKAEFLQANDVFPTNDDKNEEEDVEQDGADSAFPNTDAFSPTTTAASSDKKNTNVNVEETVDCNNEDEDENDDASRPNSSSEDTPDGDAAVVAPNNPKRWGWFASTPVTATATSATDDADDADDAGETDSAAAADSSEGVSSSLSAFTAAIDDDGTKGISADKDSNLDASLDSEPSAASVAPVPAAPSKSRWGWSSRGAAAAAPAADTAETNSSPSNDGVVVTNSVATAEAESMDIIPEVLNPTPQSSEQEEEDIDDDNNSAHDDEDGDDARASSTTDCLKSQQQSNNKEEIASSNAVDLSSFAKVAQSTGWGWRSPTAKVAATGDDLESKAEKPSADAKNDLAAVDSDPDGEESSVEKDESDDMDESDSQSGEDDEPRKLLNVNPKENLGNAAISDNAPNQEPCQSEASANEVAKQAGSRRWGWLPTPTTTSLTSIVDDNASKVGSDSSEPCVPLKENSNGAKTDEEVVEDEGDSSSSDKVDEISSEPADDKKLSDAASEENNDQSAATSSANRWGWLSSTANKNGSGGAKTASEVIVSKPDSGSVGKLANDTDDAGDAVDRSENSDDDTNCDQTEIDPTPNKLNEITPTQVHESDPIEIDGDVVDDKANSLGNEIDSTTVKVPIGNRWGWRPSATRGIDDVTKSGSVIAAKNDKQETPGDADRDSEESADESDVEHGQNLKLNPQNDISNVHTVNRDENRCGWLSSTKKAACDESKTSPGIKSNENKASDDNRLDRDIDESDDENCDELEPQQQQQIDVATEREEIKDERIHINSITNRSVLAIGPTNALSRGDDVDSSDCSETSDEDENNVHTNMPTDSVSVASYSETEHNTSLDIKEEHYCENQKPVHNSENLSQRGDESASSRGNQSDCYESVACDIEKDLRTESVIDDDDDRVSDDSDSELEESSYAEGNLRRQNDANEVIGSGGNTSIHDEFIGDHTSETAGDVFVATSNKSVHKNTSATPDETTNANGFVSSALDSESDDDNDMSENDSCCESEVSTSIHTEGKQDVRCESEDDQTIHKIPPEIESSTVANMRHFGWFSNSKGNDSRAKSLDNNSWKEDDVIPTESRKTQLDDDSQDQDKSDEEDSDSGKYGDEIEIGESDSDNDISHSRPDKDEEMSHLSLDEKQPNVDGNDGSSTANSVESGMELNQHFAAKKQMESIKESSEVQLPSSSTNECGDDKDSCASNDETSLDAMQKIEQQNENEAAKKKFKGDEVVTGDLRATAMGSFPIKIGSNSVGEDQSVVSDNADDSNESDDSDVNDGENLNECVAKQNILTPSMSECNIVAISNSPNVANKGGDQAKQALWSIGTLNNAASHIEISNNVTNSTSSDCASSPQKGWSWFSSNKGDGDAVVDVMSPSKAKAAMISSFFLNSLNETQTESLRHCPDQNREALIEPELSETLLYTDKIVAVDSDDSECLSNASRLTGNRPVVTAPVVKFDHDSAGLSSPSSIVAHVHGTFPLDTSVQSEQNLLSKTDETVAATIPFKDSLSAQRRSSLKASQSDEDEKSHYEASSSSDDSVDDASNKISVQLGAEESPLLRKVTAPTQSQIPNKTESLRHSPDDDREALIETEPLESLPRKDHIVEVDSNDSESLSYSSNAKANRPYESAPMNMEVNDRCDHNSAFLSSLPIIVAHAQGTLHGPLVNSVQSEQELHSLGKTGETVVATIPSTDSLSEDIYAQRRLSLKADQGDDDEKSDSEASSSSDSEDDTTDKKAFQLTVKEAPLLRLENVTSATRSQIPDNKKKGRWGWFGSKPKNNSNDKVSSVASSDDEGHPKQATAISAFSAKMDATESEQQSFSKGKGENTQTLPKVSTVDNISELKVSANDRHSKLFPINTIAMTNRSNNSTDAIAILAVAGVQNETNSATDMSLVTVKSLAAHPLTLSGKFDSTTIGLSAPSIPNQRFQLSLPLKKFDDPPISPLKTISPSKTKKKKKKSGIDSKLEKNVRKVSRHGDDVSVGSMNEKGENLSRAVVLTGANTLFDAHEMGERTRPWEKSINKGSKRLTKVRRKTETSFFDEEDLSKIETLRKTEELFKKSSVPTTAHDVESDDESEKQEEEEQTPAVDEANELDDIAILEEHVAFVLDDGPDADFDDMWDTVSCDVSTAIEFQRTKRKKNHEKEKKRQRREQVKDEKAHTARRLRLFERRNEKDGLHFAKNASTRLTNEFIDAIHKVFDDASMNSCESNSDDDTSNLDDFADASAHGSCKSLFMHGENESDLKESKSIVDGDSRASKHDDSNSVDDAKLKKKSRIRKDGKDNSTKKLKKRLKKARLSRLEVDASEIFAAEVRRLKNPKVLTIQSLRQEMSDMRGTSVNLLQKEYITYKKKRNDIKRRGTDDSELEQIDFGALSAQKGLSFPATSVKLDMDNEAPSDDPMSRSNGIGEQLSRWIQAEGISDLDDLATVAESFAPSTNMMGKASAAQNIPKTIGTDLKETDSSDTETKKFGFGSSTVGKNSTFGGRTGKPNGLGVGHSNEVQEQSGTAGSFGFSGFGKTTKSTETSRHPSMDLPTVLETPEDLDDMNMFNASFSDMQLTSIQEADDDDDFGLLARHGRNGNDDDDDNFTFHSSNSKRSDSGTGGNVGSRFKMGKVKVTSFGQTMKKFVPKLPKRDMTRGKSSNGFMMSDDGY